MYSMDIKKEPDEESSSDEHTEPLVKDEPMDFEEEEPQIGYKESFIKKEPNEQSASSSSTSNSFIKKEPNEQGASSSKSFIKKEPNEQSASSSSTSRSRSGYIDWERLSSDDELCTGKRKKRIPREGGEPGEETDGSTDSSSSSGWSTEGHRAFLEAIRSVAKMPGNQEMFAENVKVLEERARERAAMKAEKKRKRAVAKVLGLMPVSTNANVVPETVPKAIPIGPSSTSNMDHSSTGHDDAIPSSSTAARSSRNYVVGKILNSRISPNGILEYQLRWDGNNKSFINWLPAQELVCPKLIKEFEEQQERSRETKRTADKMVSTEDDKVETKKPKVERKSIGINTI